MDTSIKIKIETKDLLLTYKEYPRETYDNIINRLIELISEKEVEDGRKS